MAALILEPAILLYLMKCDIDLSHLRNSISYHEVLLIPRKIKLFIKIEMLCVQFLGKTTHKSWNSILFRIILMKVVQVSIWLFFGYDYVFTVIYRYGVIITVKQKYTYLNFLRARSERSRNWDESQMYFHVKKFKYERIYSGKS